MDAVEQKEFKCECGAIFFSDEFLREHEVSHVAEGGQGSMPLVAVGGSMVLTDMAEALKAAGPVPPALNHFVEEQEEPILETGAALLAVVEAVQPTTRTRSTEYRIIANTDGKMVSQDGPCLCGAAKKEWHAICLKQ